MKVYLKSPESPETAVNLNLVPKVGEHIDYGGNRFLVISVVHSVETAKTTLEVVKASSGDLYRSLQSNPLARYRTSEIRAYSPPAVSRYR